MSAPLVSIILINWNQPALTAACLSSLERCTYPALEVIVVDNGSADDSVAQLRASFPDVQIIEAGENLGFTGGNNLGMRAARGEYVMLLNNDTEVDPGFVEPLVAAGESDPTIGAMGSKIRFFDRPKTLQYAGGLPLDMRRGRGGWRGWGETDDGQYDEQQETHAAHGAAFCIRRSALEAVGLLDDDLFIFYEELDWSLRIRDAGFRVEYVPGSLVFHKESMTTGKVSPFRTYYMTRNRLLFLRRHAQRRELAAFLAWTAAASVPVNVARYTRSGRSDLLRAYVRGLRDGLSHRGIGHATGV